MTVLSGIPKPRHAIRRGDRVAIVQRPESPAVDLTGWVLNITEGKIRVAHMECDDGRPNPPEDWFRATFALSEVEVVFVP